MRGGRGIVLVALGCLVACRPTGPQRPTYKNGSTQVEDSAVIRLVENNQHMVDEADRQLSHYVDSGYALHENHYWTRGLYIVDKPLKTGEMVDVKVRVYTLDGTLMEDFSESVELGKRTRTDALTDVLTQMEHGQHVSLIAPWYTAYGAMGNEAIGPYQNVRMEITLL